MLIFCITAALIVYAAHLGYKESERKHHLTPVKYTSPHDETVLRESWYHIPMRVLGLMRIREVIWTTFLPLPYNKKVIYYSPLREEFSITGMGANLSYTQAWSKINSEFAHYRNERELMLRVIRIMHGKYKHYLIKENEFLFSVNQNVIYSLAPLESHDVQT